MASIEYITKRVEGKKKEIEKLQKKLQRIEKAEATGWEVNPYCYWESDKKYTLRDLEEAKQALEKYEAELATAQEKAGSRNVTAILQFLENWKAHVREFYADSFRRYLIDQAAWYEEDHKHTEWANNGGWRDPNRKQINEEHSKKRRAFYQKWAYLRTYLDGKYNPATGHYEDTLDTVKLERDLINEANAKYDFIIERTNKITGKITDASCLTVGEKGDLNGYIKGERGTAKVQTIGAGGYNIQCYHFRTLIHEA